MQLDKLQQLVRARLGTEVSTYYVESGNITDAINLARIRIIKDFNIERFITEATVSFVSGIGAYPSDYLRFVKKGRTEDGFRGTDNRWYTRVSYSHFDNNNSSTWTDKEGVVYIYTAETVDLTLRYIKNPVDMVNAIDDSGFTSRFDDAHSMLATYILFNDRGNERALSVRNDAMTELRKAIGREAMEEGQKPQSTFENATFFKEFGNKITL